MFSNLKDNLLIKRYIRQLKLISGDYFDSYEVFDFIECMSKKEIFDVSNIIWSTIEIPMRDILTAINYRAS